MVLSADDLTQIVNAGGGITVSTLFKRTDELLRIATAASKTGAKVIFTEVDGRDVEELVLISIAGMGNVSFDFLK
jgi:hypothetical protein